MKKALVTGGTGFIGRFLVRELVKQNVEVIAVIREGTSSAGVLSNLPVRVVRCDLCHIESLAGIVLDRDIDVVFHLAWQGVSNSDARDAKIQLSNIEATLDILRAASEMQIGTFVGAGSIHEAEALVEMESGKPISNMGFMYKTAKTAAHWMGKAEAGNRGIRFFWPLINTYGEEENSPRLVNTIIRRIFQMESPSLSAGEQFYDFVHVSDVAHALYLIAEKGTDGKNYVIGSGEAKPLKKFLSVVGEVANRLNGGTSIPLGFGQITSNVVSLPREVFDMTELAADTGFVPAVPFEEGIERTARWIKMTMNGNGEEKK